MHNRVKEDVLKSGEVFDVCFYMFACNFVKIFESDVVIYEICEIYK